MNKRLGRNQHTIVIDFWQRIPGPRVRSKYLRWPRGAGGRARLHHRLRGAGRLASRGPDVEAAASWSAEAFGVQRWWCCLSCSNCCTDGWRIQNILCECPATRVEQRSPRFLDAPADFSPLFLYPLEQFLAVNLHVCNRCAVDFVCFYNRNMDRHVIPEYEWSFNCFGFVIDHDKYLPL